MNDFEFETETFNIQHSTNVILNGVLCNSVCIVLMNRCAEYIKIIIISLYECVRLTHNMIYAIHLNDDGRSPSASRQLHYRMLRLILNIPHALPSISISIFFYYIDEKKNDFDSK